VPENINKYIAKLWIFLKSLSRFTSKLSSQEFELNLYRLPNFNKKGQKLKSAPQVLFLWVN